MAEDLRTRAAAAIRSELRRAVVCAPPGGIGVLGPTEFDLADAVLAIVQPELDRLRTEVEEDRRAFVDQPVLRHCVHPRCMREFDVSAALSGRPSRESWSSKGWFQVQVLNGYICPDHVAVVAEDAHRPQWRHGDGSSVLVCACGWESVPVRWRRYGAEAWKDHVLTINEEASNDHA